MQAAHGAWLAIAWGMFVDKYQQIQDTFNCLFFMLITMQVEVE